MTDTQLLLLDVDVVKRLAKDHPSVALRLITQAGEQMQSLAALAEDLSLKTATARLAKFLYERAKVEGARKGKAIELRRARFPEEEIASRIGAVRVHVSRSLKHLVDAGAIRLSRKVIHIPDLEVLQQLSREDYRPALQR